MNFSDYIKFAQAYQMLTNVQKRALSRFAKHGGKELTVYEVNVAKNALDKMLERYENEFEQDDWTDVVHAMFGSHLELDEVL